MESQTGNRVNAHRLQVLPGGKPGAECPHAPDTALSLICHYGVVVQRTSVGGMELVEFEFPDAA